MWGKDNIRLAHNALSGIIPTRVGKSRQPRQCGLALRDHPHSCGEKRRCRKSMSKKAGSSPRVWGKAPKVEDVLPSLRIIPTRVGKRGVAECRCPEVWDHPHACGEKFAFKTGKHTSIGSSPRVWGKAHLPWSIYSVSGIIPTRVGKRRRPVLFARQREDHPHACGEKSHAPVRSSIG